MTVETGASQIKLSDENPALADSFFFFAALSLHCFTQASLVATGGTCSLAAVRRLLFVVASLIGRARALRCADFTGFGTQLSCPVTCEILPDQGLNQWPLHCKLDS